MVRERRKALRKCVTRVYDLLLDEVEEALEEEKKRKKRVWVREWIQRRNTRGASALLLSELAIEDTKEYMCLRLTPENFESLLELVRPEISKSDTQMRDALPALEITLSYLATGNSLRSLQHMFRVSKGAISDFIPQVCDAISESLEEYIKIPNGEEEWKAMAEGFGRAWNFPICCGAIDGKHIVIQAPPNSGSRYFNHKKTISIVLMAVVDFDYCFTFIEVGQPGSENDAGVFNNGPLWLALENGLLPDGLVLVGDDAFPLKPYLIKPYAPSGGVLTKEQRICNYRFSRARRVSENAFGILVSRFRVFEGKILCKVSTVRKVVKASCTLHNWLRKTSPKTYLPPGSVDEEAESAGEIVPGRWREEIGQLRQMERFGGRRTTQLAKRIRDNLMTYFNNDGAVPWQNKFV